jgi:hypothetical protein
LGAITADETVMPCEPDLYFTVEDIAADPVDLGPSRRQPGAQPGRCCLHLSSGAVGRPDAGG